MGKEPELNFTKENMTKMGTTLCLFSMMQSFSAAQTTITSRNKNPLDWIHSSTNVSYELANTPANTDQSSLANPPPVGGHPMTGTPTIWIVMATILFSTIIITLGASIGIKYYFKRQSKNEHIEEYFNGFFITTAVYMAIPDDNCAISEYQVKTFPVLPTIVNQVN